MSEQIKSKEEREAEIRSYVIKWLRDAFANGDYRLLNRGGATPSKDYYLQIRNDTEADLRELRVKLEIYKDGVLADTVTAKTGASGIRSGETGQLAFFTKETMFSDLKLLPETVTFKTDWIPGKVMKTYEQGKKLPKRRKKKYSEEFRAGTGDLLKTKQEEYLQKLTELRDRTGEQDPEIRDGLQQLIPTIEKIFQRVAEVPGSETEIKRLTDRYLPMIINSTDSYLSYAKKNITGEDMADLKSEVVSGIRLVSEACTNLLNRLYEDGIVDASTDISVLKMLLKQDGLLGSDILKK